MLIRQICQILGKYLFYLSLALCFPLAMALYERFVSASSSSLQPSSIQAFLATFLIALGLSVCLYRVGKKADQNLHRRESILLVVLIWVVSAIVGALPFYFSRTLTHPVDALFESMSGLTTTGASVLCSKMYDPFTGEEVPIHITSPHVPDATYTYYGTVPPIRDSMTGLILYSGIEAVSKPLLFWRSLLQWLGGIGVVVIFLTVLPLLGVGGKFLYQMEMTGPIKEGISPRVRESALQIGKLYLGFTLLEIILLMATNSQMPFFDAVCVTLSNVSTGGFSVRNQSIASYKSAATEWIVFAFMIVGSINFSLFFHAFKMKFVRMHVPDFFLFLFFATVGCVFVSLYLAWDSPDYTLGQAFRRGSFQAVSLQTSTGFVTANYDLWPFPCQMILLLLMFVGGMSGSTAGGIKTSRLYILYKIVIHRLESIYRPDSVRKLYIGSQEVDDKNSQTVLAFFCLVVIFAVVGVALFVFNHIDPETSLGVVSCFLNNVGTAFRAAGPTDSFAFLPVFSKCIGILWMLLGRLEYYVMLILFLPAFWKNY